MQAYTCTKAHTYLRRAVQVESLACCCVALALDLRQSARVCETEECVKQKSVCGKQVTALDLRRGAGVW
eukprot:362789-Chlamydomonas_euryale.AAC.1